MDDRPRPALWQRLPLVRQFFDEAYSRADRVLDSGQGQAFRLLWFFLPETSIARNLRFEQVVASRFLSDAGQQALAYGALIAVAREGGSTFDLALVGVAAVLPAALLGMYGGAVADALPKRVALAAIYNLQALLCFLVPFIGGSELLPIVVLIFAVNALGQVSGPSESSVLPYVASREQLAAAASMVNLASSAGTAFGTALLAPILVRAFGVEPVMYVAGVLLLLAGTRVFDLPTDETPRAIDWRRPRINVAETVRWLVRQPAVTTMVIVGVVSGTANIVLQTLAPRYVVSALHVDPSNAVYVFAPSAVGLIVALTAAPSLMRRWGERLTALSGFVITALALFGLGIVDDIAPAVDPVNPLRIITLFGAPLSDELRTAALLALPLGFGVSLTTTSVQTYINRRVPLEYQGRAFALQSTTKNAVAIIPLLSLGAAAAAFGVQQVLLVSPFVLLGLAYALVQLSYRFAGAAPRSNLEVVASFWEGDVDVVDEQAPRGDGAGQT